MNFILVFTIKAMVILGMFHLPLSIQLNPIEIEINEIRKESGLAELKPSLCLRDRASIRLNEVKDVWSHTRPNGSISYTAKNCGGTTQGENLAKEFVSTDTAIVGWLNSPTHKEVIMSDTKYIGVVLKDGYLVMEVNN